MDDSERIHPADFAAAIAAFGLDNERIAFSSLYRTVFEEETGCENCIALGGMRVTRETLNNEYPVPSFCPYVKNFCNNTVAKRARRRPNIDWENTVSETELSGGDSLANHIIHGSDKYFRYNPHVNKQIHDSLKKVR